MARISTYAIDGIPTVNDKVIGTNVDDADVTMNYTIGDIIALVPGGSSSVQSLNTLTGDLNLIGAGGISISASGTDITITGSGGGGIQTIEGATGPDIDLAGKGGITITTVGNLINIDGSGIGGGNPSEPEFGVQFNQGGVFNAGEFFKVDVSLKNNPVVNIGKAQEIKGQLNIFAGAGEGAFYGETRYYDALGSGQFAAWASPGQILKQSYAVALPENEPAPGQVLVIDKTPTSSSPFTSIWSTVGGSADEKFKIDAADTSSGFWLDKITMGSGITQTVLTDKDGIKTIQLNGSSVSTVNSIKVGSSTAQGTFGFTGSGVTMTNGGAGDPGKIIDFNYQDPLVSGTNIKTINSQSILGSGDIVVSGGTPAGVAGSVQINDGTNFSADTNLTWDTTNNILTVGNENNPVFQEGILLLKGNGSNLGGRVQFQTGIGKAAAAIVTLQGPEQGAKQEISLPGALPTDVGLALTVKSITGTEVETEWKAAGGGGGTVTSVGGTAPIVSSGGNTPSLSMAKSTRTVDGYLDSGDFVKFDDKQAALVSGSNIKTVNGNSLLGSGNLAITATAAPGGTSAQIQYNNNSVLDGNVGLTLDTGTAGLTKVQIGSSLNPTFRYGVLKLTGNGSTEGGKIEFETGASKGSPETIILQAPDTGAAQEISLPESLPTADTQILGIKSISGTSVQTQWETPTGGGTSLPYTSYEANFSVASNNVSEKVLNNTTGATVSWISTGAGQLKVTLSGLAVEPDVLVLLNGFGGNKGQMVQCFFGGYNKSQAEITIDILDLDFAPAAVDISQGNIEIRVY
jgi:hypothetical protein